VTITVSQKVEKRKKKSRNKWIKRENLEGKNKAKKSKSRDLTLKASCVSPQFSIDLSSSNNTSKITISNENPSGNSVHPQ